MFSVRRVLLAALLIAVLAATFINPIAAAPLVQGAPPAQSPQPLSGRQIYTQNCAPCHGQAGKGDGPSASGLAVSPTALADYAQVSGKSLSDLFNLTKNGNMQRMMPPWKNQLTDQEIWDAVGFAWTLHTTTDEIAAGKAVYEKQCTTCHGADGKGKPLGLDFTDFAKTSTVNQATWAEVLATGRNTMSGFGDKLSASDQRAVLEYVRSLSMGPMVQGSLPKGAGVITGTVTNGTTGQPVANASVELGIFDATSLLESRGAVADASGTYRFAELPTDTTLIYVARVVYGGADNSYSSEPAQFQAGQSALNLPVAVFETTTDASGIRADRVHLIVDFQDNQLQIDEMLVFSLSGNRAYIGDGTGVLRFTLPQGAQNLQISDGEIGGRYMPVQNGFVDLLPLTPGTGTRQILYHYSVPYSQGALDLTRAIPYPAAAVNALVTDVGAKVSSDQLQDQGTRTTQGGNFISLAALNVPANQPLTLRFRDLPLGATAGASGADQPVQATSDRAPLLVLIGVGGLIAALLVALPLLRRRPAQVSYSGTDQDSLIDALARLDIAYRAGEMTESIYQDQRMRLKAQLLDAVPARRQA